MDDKYELKDAGKHYYHNNQSEAEADDDEVDDDFDKKLHQRLYSKLDISTEELDILNAETIRNQLTSTSTEKFDIFNSPQENRYSCSTPRERRERREQRDRDFRIHSLLDKKRDDEELLKLINIKDERFCNFAWCYLKHLIFRKLKDREISSTEIDIASEAQKHLSKITSNHQERHKEIISTIKQTLSIDLPRNNYTSELIKYLAVKFNKIKSEIRLPKIEGESDILWAFDYVNKKIETEPDLQIDPTSTMEKYASTVAKIDMYYYIDKDDASLFLMKLHKAFSQRKKRKAVIAINLKIQEDIEGKLKYISKKTNKSKSEIIKNLINKEYETMLNNAPPKPK